MAVPQVHQPLRFSMNDVCHNPHTQVDHDGMIVILADTDSKDGRCARIDLVDPVDGNTIETHALSGYHSLKSEFKVLSSGEIVYPYGYCFKVIDSLRSEAKLMKSRTFRQCPIYTGISGQLTPQLTCCTTVTIHRDDPS